MKAFSVDTETMEWTPSESPGVFYKSLRYDKQTKAGAVLIKMDAGSSYPEHIHTNGEEFLVLNGDLIVEDEVFSRGAYVYSPPDSIHHPRTDTGCVLFAVFHGKIVHK